MAKSNRPTSRPAKPRSKKADATPSAPPVEATPAAEAVTTPALVLRKKDLLDRVADASGARKKDARAIIDATLQILGEALSRGETLVLPPLGKARVNRSTDKSGGETLVIKLRRAPGEAKKVKETAQEGVAEGGDHV